MACLYCTEEVMPRGDLSNLTKGEPPGCRRHCPQSRLRHTVPAGDTNFNAVNPVIVRAWQLSRFGHKTPCLRLTASDLWWLCLLSPKTLNLSIISNPTVQLYRTPVVGIGASKMSIERLNDWWRVPCAFLAARALRMWAQQFNSCREKIPLKTHFSLQCSAGSLLNNRSPKDSPSNK